MKRTDKENMIRLSDHFTYGRILKFCLPTMGMMVFTSIYGVVDGLFISNFVGKNAFAAVNLSMPVIMILSGIGTVFGSGGTALIAKTLGEKKKDRANAYFSMMLEIALIIGIIITVIGYLEMEKILIVLGASKELLPDAVLYGRICVLFIIPCQFQYMFQSFVNLAEKPRLGLIITLAAGFANMILDAVFVGTLGMGVFGAALATGISQVVGGILPLLYFILPNPTELRFRLVMLEMSPVLKAAYNGLSELMSTVSGSVVSMVYNAQLLKYIGADGVAAYGVFMYAQFIFLGVSFGYAMGASPVVGFHYGAKNHGELQNLLKISYKIEYIGGALLFLLAQLLVRPIVMVFVGYDAGLVELTVHAFRIFLLAFLLSGGNLFASALFTALNNGTISASVSFVRTLVFELLSVLILPILVGVNGIWASIFVAECASAILSWFFIIKNNKRYHYLTD